MDFALVVREQAVIVKNIVFGALIRDNRSLNHNHKKMRFEPYLWLHLAGIAAAPLFLEGVGVGLAVSDPFPVFWLELLVIGVIGIVPILWMQWNRPFYIFSLLLVSVQPTRLNDNQRRILSRFKTPKQRWLSALTAVAMGGILWVLYRYAPLAGVAADYLPQWRILGLFIACIAFLLSNLFIQVPIAVLGVLSTPDKTFAVTSPYPTEAILSQFTAFGLRINTLLFKSPQSSSS